ncbi:MAG TPA: transglutaminase-like domain-containing protein [Candidatus Brocadiia bacterium]|nr:transglutaminase-like domain-containing protein [Candidatus Brocadiia bacterium]
MPTPRRAALLLAAFVYLAAARAAEPQTLREVWHSIHLAGHRVGCLHETVVRYPGPTPVIRSAGQFNMTLKRLGQTVQVQSEMSYDEEEATGAIRSFTLETRASVMSVSASGVVQDGKLILIKSGQKKPEILPWDAACIGPYAGERLLLAQPLKAGRSVQFKTFSLDVFKPALITMRVEDKERVSLPAGPQDLWRVVMTQDVIPGLPITTWITPDGETQKTNTNMMGVDLEMFRCSKEEALRPPEEGEVFLTLATLPLDRPVEHPRNVRQAIFRFTFRNPEALKIDLAGERQTVLARDGGSTLLQVRAQPPPANTSLPVPPGFEHYLAASSYIQSDDPAIQAKAREIAGKEKDPWLKAKALETWVHKSIWMKGYDVAFASAAETLKTRRGDCSEHAVLLAALLRAQGIPARLASGAAYFEAPGAGPALGGHVWTEAWIGGQWNSLDATLAAPFVDAMRVRLAVTALELPSGGADFLNLLHVLGQTSAELVAYEYGPPK